MLYEVITEVIAGVADGVDVAVGGDGTVALGVKGTVGSGWAVGTNVGSPAELANVPLDKPKAFPLRRVVLHPLRIMAAIATIIQGLCRLIMSYNFV